MSGVGHLAHPDQRARWTRIWGGGWALHVEGGGVMTRCGLTYLQQIEIEAGRLHERPRATTCKACVRAYRRECDSGVEQPISPRNRPFLAVVGDEPPAYVHARIVTFDEDPPARVELG